VQIDFRSIPEDLVLISPPTQLTNRSQHRELTYALVPCRPLRGLFTGMTTGTDAATRMSRGWRASGSRPATRKAAAGSDGGFIMYNLPDLWRELLKVDKDQPLYSGSLSWSDPDHQRR